MLKIGITPSFFYPNLHPHVHGKKILTFVENDLINYIASAGNLPILIPELKYNLLASFMKELQAIIFQGGADISPQFYGQDPIENGKWPGDAYRDNYEIQILKIALDLGIPILGICRGFQLINVFFKGTLFQDLAIQTKSQIPHRDEEKYDKLYHSISFSKGSLLESLYKSSPLLVNSIHHQGIHLLAQDLVVEAFCPEDNLVEAFRHKNSNHFIFGVQWHPEFSHTLGDKILDPNPLLDYFMNETCERTK